MDKAGSDGRSGCNQTWFVLITYLYKDASTFHKNGSGSQFGTIFCTDLVWSRLNMVFKNETSV